MDREDSSLNSSETVTTNVGTYMAKVSGLMALGVAICTGTALTVGSNAVTVQTLLGTWLVLPLLLAPFGILIFIHKLREENKVVLQFLGFLTLTAILGIWMSATMLKLLSNPDYVNILVQTLGATCGMFGGLCVAGFFSPKDLSSTGTCCIAALFGLITLGVINAFYPLGLIIHLIYSCIGLWVFLGLTAYDVQRIKQEYLVKGDSNSNAISGAIELVFDFLYIFNILLLHMGIGGGDD